MKHYTITGDPVPRLKPPQKICWDDYKHAVFRVRHELESQHADKPLIDVPLSLRIEFYIQGRKKDIEAKKAANDRLILGEMVRFVEEMIKSVLVHDSCTIVHISASKCFDSNPRTELYFTEIK